MGLYYYSDRTERKSQVVSVARRGYMTLSPDMLARMGCKACPLDREENRLIWPKMEPTGSASPLIYVLGEAPGVEEDKEGRQFIGASGRLIRNALRNSFQLRDQDDEDEWVRWSNTIRCHPHKNRDPEPVELSCCMPKQHRDIDATRPKVILTCGKIALRSLVGEDGISAWRGRRIAYQYQDQACWLVPTFHPAYILRASSNRGHSKADRSLRDLQRFFEDDVDFAVDLSRHGGQPTGLLKPETVHNKVRVIRSFSDIISALKHFEGGQWSSTDLETTGKHPFHHDARILTAAMCDGESTISFPISHPEAGFSERQQDQICKEYKAALVNSEKVWCHNLNFELEWLVWKYGPDLAYALNGQDTMAQAYVLDERTGAMALNDLCLMYLGLKIKELTELDKANMIEEPLERILPYNGVDSKVTSMIAPIQHELLKDKVLEAVYERHRTVSRPISIMQNLGMKPDFDEVDRLIKKYNGEADAVQEKILDQPDVIKYIATKDKDFSPTSPKSVSKLFMDLGYEAASAGSDEKILKEVNHPVAELILSLREYNKLCNTYLRPLQKELYNNKGKLLREAGKHIGVDNFVHTQFNHLLVSTGRLSSENPNMQNMPMREHPDVRGVIAALKAHYILSIDYGQIEARVIAMASLDKFLVKAIWEGYDIHAEWAERLARAVPRIVGGKKFLSDKAIMKTLRSKVKNRWTFPLFYRAALPGVAPFFECQEHELRPLFDQFWQQMPGVRAWQDKLIEFYDKNFYVECLTGRRRHGPMTPNMLVNSPIQGTASDIVVDAMQKLSRHAVESEQMFFHPRLNVHDDLTFYMPDDDKMEDNIDYIARVMVGSDWHFINVPLTVELKLGRNWAKMKEIAVISSEDYK